MNKKNADGTDVVPSGDEVIDQEAVNAAVAEAVAEAINTDEATDAISEKLFAKFTKKFADKSQTKAVVARGEDTRAFVKALATRDNAYLKEKALNTGSDADGGYLVPEELLSEILRIAPEGYGVARAEMRYLPFGGAAIKRIIPKLASSVAVYWTDEGAKKSGTKATFGVVTQILKKLAAIVPMTEELLEDTEIDIVKLLAELFVEAVSIEEDLQYFDGDGTVWTGLLRTTAIPSLAIGTGTTFAAMTADDLLALQSKVKKGARSRGKYFAHTSVIDLVRKMKDGSGQYIFEGPRGDAPAKLWGKEIVEVEAMPSTDLTAPNQANRSFVLFGDMKLGAIYGDKKDIRVKMLDQATITDADGSTVINLAQQDMVGMRVVKYTGYVVANEQALARLKTNAS